jgi:sporulenol synthase
MDGPALHAACAYLLSRQGADGHFADYRLPVGRSDQWVTALAGLALAEGAPWHPAAAEGAGRAAAWLARRRSYRAGWGFNGQTGPDADSTAHVLQLFSVLALPVADADVAWLMDHRRHGEGFSTYRRSDGWGEPHPDVTAVAFFGMPIEERIAYGDDLAEWLLARRDPAGFWPSYWWRGRYYATYWSLRLLRTTGRSVSIPTAIIFAPSAEIHSCFELGWAAGVLAMDARAQPAWRAAVTRLFSRQSEDGSWPSSADLRVTDLRYRRPWSEPPLADDRTRYYADVERIVTTASVLRAVTDCTPPATALPGRDQP